MRAVAAGLLITLLCAASKDAKALEGAGDSITVACETCHQPYRDGGRQMRGNAR
jgi:cytochrome c556